MSKTWELKQTKQCAKCPWLKSTNPLEIPGGYSVELHQGLRVAIADPDGINLNGPLQAMACHETHTSHCLGWLANQVGRGNNIALRLALSSCSNVDQVELIGEQHETFDDTLPTV